MSCPAYNGGLPHHSPGVLGQAPWSYWDLLWIQASWSVTLVEVRVSMVPSEAHPPPGIDTRVVLVSTAEPPGDHSHQVVVLTRRDTVSGPAGDQGAAGVTLTGALATLSSSGVGAQHVLRDA